MTWHAYRLVYRLESPLHVGWRKTGNLMQTRPYITGRNWWGAATACLTQWLGNSNYQSVGELVQERLIFGYFFPTTEPGISPLPHCETDDFERRFLSSLTSTAIEAQHNTAAEGQLHEVEFIVPHTREGLHVTGSQVFMVGHLLARDGDRITCDATEVYVDGVRLLTEVLAQARIGGERRYGFGRVSLVRDQVAQCNDIFGHTLHLSVERPTLTLNTSQPLPTHCSVASLEANGEIEPLLGREWHVDKGPGRDFSAVTICWMPGAKARHPTTITIGPMGVGI